MFITISRQYAAGGSSVARCVAEGLGWDVVDNEFFDELADRSGFSREEVAELDERVPSFLERFAQSTALSFPEYLATTPGALDEPGAEKIARITRGLVEELGRVDPREVLVPGGAFVLEATPEAALRAAADRGPTKVASAGGLFSERPHHTVHECAWFDGERAAVDRWVVTDDVSGERTVYGSTRLGWNEDELCALLLEVGFAEVEVVPSLGGDDPGSDDEFPVYVARGAR